MTTTDLLQLLKQNAARDFASAESLPPGIYHNPQILELEKARLFLPGWIAAGRALDIPRPGDYLTFDLLEQPIVIIRQKDTSLRAFANVCRHRSAKLLDGCGHVSKISCPYHSWTYELGGQLIAAPFMQRTPGFDVGDYRLQELACEQWQGFIYVSLHSRAPPLAPQLADLESEIADFRIADYVPVHKAEEVWSTNWKCLVENFMDVYHLHRVHAKSFNKYSSNEETTHFFPGGDAYSYHYVQEDGGPHSVAAHAANTWLQGSRRHRTYLINIYPGQVMQLQPDMLWSLSIQPQGQHEVRIRWALSIPAEILNASADRERTVADALQLLLQVNSEDKPTVEGVCVASKSASATPGPLSWLERNCFDFGRYLARELTD